MIVHEATGSGDNDVSRSVCVYRNVIRTGLSAIHRFRFEDDYMNETLVQEAKRSLAKALQDEPAGSFTVKVANAMVDWMLSPIGRSFIREIVNHESHTSHQGNSALSKLPDEELPFPD